MKGQNGSEEKIQEAKPTPETIEYTPEQLKEIRQRVEPLMEIMRKRETPEKMKMLEEGFEFACEAHKGQYRKTGEPYIIHPIAVARIVGEELELGADAVCAAFLHDVVEDTPTTVHQIKEKFGDDVSFLVDVVTKTKKEKYQTSLQVDNFRRMLNSIRHDIRALLIKLADRLHNMRTLSSMAPHKQMKIAGETDYFYAPLAQRLGLYPVKVELENLSFRYRCPREYARIEQLLEENKKVNQPVLDRFMDIIRKKLQENGIEAMVESAYRKPFTILTKMLKRGGDFKHVKHKNFVRIVYKQDINSPEMPEKNLALKIYSLLTDCFKEQPGSLVNYIDSPKQNGYQCMQVKLLADNGKWVEVHISSERMQRKSKLGCIVERNDENISGWIAHLKASLQDIAAHKHEINFMEGVKSSFYNDDITVYTPQGKSIKLPQRSTALDFAFEVHTAIGLSAKYARINNIICSIFTPLNQGDAVEICTSEDIHPKEEWLDHVLTYKAKRHITSYLKNLPKQPFTRCPHCKPIPGDEVIGYKEEDGTLVVHRRDCPTVISKASQNGDNVTVVEFESDPNILYPVKIHIQAVDRYRLLMDLVSCLSDTLYLSISSLETKTLEEIVDCNIAFSVHDYNELKQAMDTLRSIEGVDEVSYVEKG